MKVPSAYLEITYTDIWDPIDDDALMQWNIESEAYVEEGIDTHYDHGLKLKDSMDDFDYPFILLRVDLQKQLNEEQILRFVKSMTEDKAYQLIQGKIDLQSLQIDLPYYDQESQIVYLLKKSINDDKSSTAVLAVFYFFRYGVLHQYFYSESKAFSEFAPKFGEIIRGTHFQAEGIYQVNYIQKELLKLVRSGFGYIILIGFCALLVILMKKKNQT